MSKHAQGDDEYSRGWQVFQRMAMPQVTFQRGWLPMLRGCLLGHARLAASPGTHFHPQCWGQHVQPRGLGANTSLRLPRRRQRLPTHPRLRTRQTLPQLPARRSDRRCLRRRDPARLKEQSLIHTQDSLPTKLVFALFATFTRTTTVRT